MDVPLIKPFMYLFGTVVEGFVDERTVGFKECLRNFEFIAVECNAAVRKIRCFPVDLSLTADDVNRNCVA